MIAHLEDEKTTSLVVTRTAYWVTTVLLVFAAVYWLKHLRTSLLFDLDFDDSFMFYRYALHMRQGLGMSWNLDGIHTFGETSQLWGWVVLLLSYLPVSATKALMIGSWVFSVGAVWGLSWAVSRNAESEYLKGTWRVMPMVAWPLILTYMFRANAVTGMETMLAATLCSVFAGLVLGWSNGNVQPLLVAFAGFLLFLVRPESAVVVVMMPVLAWLFFIGRTRKGLGILLGCFLACVAIELIACKIYYGTAVPLSLYMKSGHRYDGYAVSNLPFTEMMMLLASYWPFVALLMLLTGRSDWRLVSIFLLPASVVFAYLLTVAQIMGKNSRYYLPYIGLIVIPALLVLDRRMAAGLKVTELLRGKRIKVLACCAVIAGIAAVYVNQRVVKIRTLSYAIDKKIERRSYIYEPAHFQTAAKVRLPVADGFVEFVSLTKRLLEPLPQGSTVAASEVGYIGAYAPHVNVIDIAGLNDTEIAFKGFDMKALLAREPVIIWMPHSDYTYQRGMMLSDPEFLNNYDYYVGAARFGIALRKDSPLRPLIDRQMQLFWADLYPQYKMSDYLAKAVRWSGAKRAASWDDQITKEYERDQLDYDALEERRN